jgi:hypothetical protein
LGRRKYPFIFIGLPTAAEENIIFAGQPMATENSVLFSTVGLKPSKLIMVAKNIVSSSDCLQPGMKPPQKILDPLSTYPRLSTHYVRKAHSRCARTKNGDVQITCLCHHVSHYRVIRDVRPSVSLISIHGRCATSECVTYLISGWGPYATNLRHALRVRVSYF